MEYNNLHQVYLDQDKLEGFRNFISAWIYADANSAFVVDPGPLTTIPVLLDELHRLGVRRLDYILLTHIHIDHAGGTGELLRHFPEAMVVCHPAGIRHMCEPKALWEGSLKVLGHVARAYGEIIPVPAESITSASRLEDIHVDVIQTPGHAAHHLSFMFDDLLIAGEVAGVCCNTPQGIYMRPATPPRFDLDIALTSLDKVMQRRPQHMIFAHSTMQSDAMSLLEAARKQLYVWVGGVARQFLECRWAGKADASQEEELRQSMYTWLLRNDPLFAPIESMPEDIHAREMYFFGNSIKGMSEYVANLDQPRREELTAHAVT
jgi:glyoxylase-like metal-dependent hydrolase (beta-lactamase superfamily II)